VTLNNPVSWRELLAEVEAQLADANEARWICEHASGCDRNKFLSLLNDHVSSTMARNVHEMLARRLTGEPLQYVMQRWSFRHLDVMVDTRVLIPRSETEQVVEVALGLARQLQQRISKPITIVDLGTGSGVIGLSMACELGLGSAKIWLTDLSDDALHVARANLSGIGRAAEHVRVLHGNWYGALPTSLHGAVDLIVCNPPYIAEGDPEVASDVNAHEPHVALYAGSDGLDALREVIATAPEWLVAGGWLISEIGYRQGEAVGDLFARASFTDVEIINDLTGRPRIARGRNRI
jgi:release factor glutamine methyltransferase